MSARFKPGDMAIVVRTCPLFGQYLGRIVTLVRVSEFDWWNPGICWVLDFEHGGKPVTASESCLRPIRDPGDDAVDEMVRLVGEAPKTLTEVREVSHG